MQKDQNPQFLSYLVFSASSPNALGGLGPGGGGAGGGGICVFLRFGLKVVLPSLLKRNIGIPIERHCP